MCKLPYHFLSSNWCCTRLIFDQLDETEAVAQRCSVKKRILRNFAKLAGKHLCQCLFKYTVAADLLLDSDTVLFLRILRKF